MKRFLCLGAVLILCAICLGCGDVFRPIIIPNPQQFPNPQATHTVVTISDNANLVSGQEIPQAGSVMSIDVSGDTDVSQKTVGVRPVHLVQQSANTVLLVNQSTQAQPQDSIVKLTFSGAPIGSVTTITLPASFDGSGKLVSAAPNFVATTESAQAYVSMPLYQPPNQQGIGGVIVPSIAAVNTTANSIVTTFQTGTTANANPVAMAETPDGHKLYVANLGDGTISGFNTLDRSARGISGTLSSPPIWLSARSDSQRLYALEVSGTLASVDTTTTSGPDNLTETSINAGGATYMWYDVIRNRLYIPQGAAQQITIVDVSQASPSVIGGGPLVIPALPPTSRVSGDPCAATTQNSPLFVAAATSLPDGSRAYVGSFYVDSNDNICPQVTVINAPTTTIKTTVAVPGFPDATNPSSPFYVPICANTRFRFNMAAAGDSTRAYLSSCDGGNVNIIDTSTDTYIVNDPAPHSARPPIPPSTQNPPQNPVFMIAGP